MPSRSPSCTAIPFPRCSCWAPPLARRCASLASGARGVGTLPSRAAVALAAAWTDLRRFRIPNALPLLLVALYPLHLAAANTPVDWQGGLSLALILLLGGFALFAAGLLGAGDVKLLAAAGLWAARDLGGELVLITTLAGGALALTLLTPWGKLVLAAVQTPETAARKIGSGTVGITRLGGADQRNSQRPAAPTRAGSSSSASTSCRSYEGCSSREGL